MNAFRNARELLVAGRRPEALNRLEPLGKTCGAPEISEILAHTLFAEGFEDEAFSACRRALRTDPAHPGLNTLLGQFLLHQGETVQALDAFRSAAGGGTAPNEALLNMHGLNAARESDGQRSPDAPGVLITSIPPGDHECHGRCVASWRSQGFRVLSLNSATELDVLTPAFPDVEFIEAFADAREETGKPHVYVDDLLQVLAEQPERVCGIVNADILFRAEQGFGPWLRHHAAKGLVFGSRADMDSLSDTAGRMYSVGFDYFLFPADSIPRLSAQGIPMGTPWWDYMLPLSAMDHSLPVSRVISPMALHKRHDLNWSQGLFWQNGLRVLKTLMDDRVGLLAEADTLVRHNEGYATLLAGVARMLAERLNAKPDRLLFNGKLRFQAPFDEHKYRFPFPTMHYTRIAAP